MSTRIQTPNLNSSLNGMMVKICHCTTETGHIERMSISGLLKYTLKDTSDNERDIP